MSPKDVDDHNLTIPVRFVLFKMGNIVKNLKKQQQRNDAVKPLLDNKLYYEVTMIKPWVLEYELNKNGIGREVCVCVCVYDRERNR